MTLAIPGYVDDVNSRTSGNMEENKLTLMAEKDAQLWHDLLWSSGGKLELSKSYYRHIRYDTDKIGNPRLRPGMEWMPPMRIKTADGHYMEIKPANSITDHKSLGCLIGPQGKLKDQLREIKTKCAYYANLARHANLTRREADMFYRSVFVASTSYPLDSTYFTESQLDGVQASVLSAMLSSMGYNKCTARAIVFGPANMGGIGIQRLYDRQSLGLIKMFIKHWRERDMVGEFLRKMLAWAQYIAGTSTPIMEDWEELPPLPTFIINKTRQFLKKINSTIEVDEPNTPE